ncbi:MAG: hypothetical protein JWO36_3952 [Myxococcales bacterium]|nr:hypothetical protein [Myxococcales bacterium]
MKRLWVFAVVVACGHPLGVASPPPKHLDPPPGQGWWCAPSPGGCNRDQQKCEQNAAQLGAERPCTPLVAASCFASSSGLYACAAKQTVCVTLRDYAWNHGEDIVQDCTSVP